MSDPVPSSAISDATVGGLSVIVVAGGSTGDVLVKQSDGTYLPTASGVSDKVSKSGDTMTGALSLPRGAVTAPSIKFGDSTSGIWSIQANAISVAISSFEIFRFSAGDIVYCFSSIFQCYNDILIGSSGGPRLRNSGGALAVRNNAGTGGGNVSCGDITASGVIAAASNSAHTFGAIGTQVLLTAGVITCTGSGLTRTLTPSAAGFTSNRGFTCDNGSVVFVQPTTGLMLTSGTGARAGTATLVAGTVTVTNTSVTTNTRIFLTVRTAGGTLGTLSYTLSAGASFTINSSSASDTSTITYFLIEVL